MPADDLTDPAPATSFAHLDATTTLSRSIAEKGIYPAVDPLNSTSRMLTPAIVGEEHLRRGPPGAVDPAALQGLVQDIIAILGMDGFSEEGSSSPCRAPRGRVRTLHLAALRRGRRVHRFAGRAGKLEDTIKGFKGLCNGDYDHLPEPAFYMVGTIEEAVAKAKKLAADAA